jgi:hypothetical protein
MSVLNALHRVIRNAQARVKRPLAAARHRRRNVTLRLEALEDRTLLSVVVVDRLTDNNPGGAGEGGNGMGDLRWCIVQSRLEADTITFAVTGIIILGSRLPTLTRSVSIEGPGPNLLIVRRGSGGGYSIFTVDSFVTVSISGRGCGGSALRDRNADLEEHLLQSRRSNGNQHPGGFAALVLERVWGADRHVGEHPGPGDEPTLANEENDLAFKDVKAAVEPRVHVHDLHATILHLLGFDHERLTYRYAGRDFRLTDVQGHVVRELLA